MGWYNTTISNITPAASQGTQQCKYKREKQQVNFAALAQNKSNYYMKPNYKILTCYIYYI